MKSLKFSKSACCCLLSLGVFVASCAQTDVVYEIEEKVVDEQSTMNETIERVYKKLAETEEVVAHAEKVAAKIEKAPSIVHITTQSKFQVSEHAEEVVDVEDEAQESSEQSDSELTEELSSNDESLSAENAQPKDILQQMIAQLEEQRTQDASKKKRRSFKSKKKEEELSTAEKTIEKPTEDQLIIDEDKKSEVQTTSGKVHIENPEIHQQTTEEVISQDAQTEKEALQSDSKSQSPKQTLRELIVINKKDFVKDEQSVEQKKKPEVSTKEQSKPEVLTDVKKEENKKELDSTKDSSSEKASEKAKEKAQQTNDNESSKATAQVVLIDSTEKNSNSSDNTKVEPSDDDNTQQLSAEETAQNSVQSQALSVESTEDIVVKSDAEVNDSVETKAEAVEQQKKIRNRVQKVYCDECLQKFDILVENVEDDIYSWKLNSVSNMSMIKEWIQYVSQRTSTKVGKKWLLGKFDAQLLKESALVLSDVLKKYEQIGVTIYLDDNKSVNFLSKSTVDFTYKDSTEYKIRLECSNVCHLLVLNNSYMSVYSKDLRYNESYDVNDLFSIKVRSLKN